MNSTGPDPQSRRAELTSKYVVLLFTVGVIMLVAPVGTVLSENSMCKANLPSCNHTDAYRYLVSAFPYIMLGGGVLIAYNMKRISDQINSQSQDESDKSEREEGDSDVYHS